MSIIPTGRGTRIARYRVSADPDLADPGSADILLTVAQPYTNHNGGQLRFGPDGFLYIGLGDGGSGGDPENRAQDLSELLGK
ncbi:MAG: PQQ-dependent sugar dehydrogenase, partial [Rhodospirillales bacterium]|nr:PQQ-dependent sugar dehydrogenase [Rhodospirillales bacterium]